MHKTSIGGAVLTAVLLACGQGAFGASGDASDWMTQGVAGLRLNADWAATSKALALQDITCQPVSNIPLDAPPDQACMFRFKNIARFGGQELADSGMAMLRGGKLVGFSVETRGVAAPDAPNDFSSWVAGLANDSGLNTKAEGDEAILANFPQRRPVDAKAVAALKQMPVADIKRKGPRAAAVFVGSFELTVFASEFSGH